MNRKHTIVCLVCILIAFVAVWFIDSNEPGIAYNAQITIGESERFTQEEIESAANIIVSEFDIVNRELISLWYDEDLSNQAIAQSHLEDIDKDSTILFFSTITVLNQGVFAPGDLEYLGWMLVRNAQTGEWELYTHGFAGVNF